MNRVVVIGIIFLFIASSVIPISGLNLKQPTIQTSSSDILYVGGNGPGNYSRIQDAVNDASDGDIVFVYNGTYYENIIIDKTINLTGEIKEETIIDGLYNGNIVHISSEKVTLQNFTIRNSGGFTKNAGIIIESKNNIENFE